MVKRDVSVVLTHGAWADGSSWTPVITALEAEGVKVSAAPLPLTSLTDDVAALNRSLDRTEGPIVLAGHAYAGAVIALARPERVKALVYLLPMRARRSRTCSTASNPIPKRQSLHPTAMG
jgi:pimeloyl-ACP methyl ester carboxylesterase